MDSLVWPTPFGTFAFGKVYDLIRPTRPSLMSYEFIWRLTQQPAIQVFLWRLYHNALPLPDNLLWFSIVLPSRCFFCQADSASMSHLLFSFPEVRTVWSYFSALLDVSPLMNANLQSYLLRIWCSAPRSFLGEMQMVFPGILLWNVWKMYAAIVFDSLVWSLCSTIRTIRTDIFLCAKSMSGTKIVENVSSLI